MSRGALYNIIRCKAVAASWPIRVLLAWLAVACPLLPVEAQDEPEYRMEIGGGVGMTAYEGDLNGNLLHEMQPQGMLVAKYKMNPRMAWSAVIGVGKLKGSSSQVETWYPVLAEHPVTFSTTFTDLQVRYEYNFWAFGTGQEYHGARPFAPFIALGIGLAWANSKVKGYPEPVETVLEEGELSVTPMPTHPNDGSAAAFQMPFGVGVKWKIRPRLNFTAEWTMHFTSSDRFDGLHDPYGIKSSGLFKNTDCYSTIGVSITYDIWAKCKTCHSDRDL